MSPIGRLETEGDVERFVSSLFEQQLTGLRSQGSSLFQSVQALQGGLYGAYVPTGEATATNPYVDLATVGPSVTVDDAATYAVVFGAQFTAGSAVTPYLICTVGGVSGDRERRGTLSTATGFGQIWGGFVAALSAGDVLLLRYGSQAAISVTFSGRFLLAVRLS